MEICLGTVQQGMDYGIHGKTMPPADESIALFAEAVRQGVHIMDTAAQYGEAENLLGSFLRRTRIPEPRIVSKLRPNILDGVDPPDYDSLLVRELRGSLDRMGIAVLDGYLLHSSRYVFQEEIVRAMHRLKATGLVRNVGVSIYTPQEALQAADSPFVDYIQIPYNPLDQRLLATDFFKRARGNGKTVFARSTFLQGLLLTKPEEIPQRLAHARELVGKFQQLAGDIPLHRACVAFSRAQAGIDYLIVGVRNIEQLTQDLEAFRSGDSHLELLERMEVFRRNVDESVVIPSLWGKD